ncbi:hypothetical protein ACHAPF_004069 [Botrytis cinerea]
MEITLLLILLGSAWYTGAPTTTFPCLGIPDRSIQRISVGSINAVVRTILENGVSLKEYAKNNSSFFIVAGLSFALGLVIGGYVIESN